MKITFPNRYAIDSNRGGINFSASVNDQDIICHISSEALQDINSTYCADPIEKLFEDNKMTIQSIAEQKIRNGDSNIFISSNDVRKR